MTNRVEVRAWISGALLLLSGALVGCSQSDPLLPRADESVTFSKHLAPIVFEHCAYCHRPGESGPFHLLTYRDARMRAEQNVEVTQSRFMPPWQPERGLAKFVGERGLTDEQIEVFRRWFKDGMLEGDPEDLPPTPEWSVGWQLGEPDLLIQPERSYTLRADGIDVYHTLVVPIPIERPRYVRAIDLRPGNPQAVHHVVMRIDRSRSAQLMDRAYEEQTGYPGMDWGDAQPPEGRFLGWTPGKMPYDGEHRASWEVEPGSDLLLQMHMVPVGKPEPIRPKIGFYFTDEPPSSHRETVVLDLRQIDIPAGVAEYVSEVSYELPVAVDAVDVYPHAHYIGKKLLAWATLPDGSTKWLLRIQDWDFSWQDQYYYAEPVSLPAGTTLTGRFTYDNSADNPNNPNQPPQRMISGNRSTEEMGSISFEVILRRREDRDVLRESLLRQDLATWPKHWRLNSLLGALLVNRGEHEQAAEFLWRALKLNPDDATGLNNLGVTLAHSGNHRGAQTAFNRALNLRPQYPDAHYNLGVELAALGKTDEAIAHYRRALDVRSYDADVHNNLGVALAMQSRFELATSHFRRALDIDPDSVDARGNLGNMFLQQGRYDEAVRHYRRALESRPDSEILQTNLSIALQRQTAGDTLQDSTQD